MIELIFEIFGMFGVFGKLFFVFLAVEILSGLYMETSDKNIFTKIFIVIGDILQLYWGALVFLLFAFLALPRGAVYDTEDGICYSYEPEQTGYLIVVTLIFLVFAFLPYRVSKLLYRGCYSRMKLSERWIIPSYAISIITVVLYAGYIINFLVNSIGKLITGVILVHIIIFVLITVNFFRKKASYEMTSEYSFMTKFLSVILNMTFAVIAFFGVKLGLLLILTEDFIPYAENFHLGDYITGMIISEVSVFLPYGMNLLLYKCLYKKNGLSKWWTFPAILVSAGVFVLYWSGLTCDF